MTAEMSRGKPVDIERVACGYPRHVSNAAELRRLVDKLELSATSCAMPGCRRSTIMEQLSFLLFLKMADERQQNFEPGADPSARTRHLVGTTLKLDGVALEEEYRRILSELGRNHQPGVVFVGAEQDSGARSAPEAGRRPDRLGELVEHRR